MNTFVYVCMLYLAHKLCKPIKFYDIFHYIYLLSDQRVTLKEHYSKYYTQKQRNKLLKLTIINTEKLDDVDCGKIFETETKLLMISGVTGIGKTCFLKMCLFDWANESLRNDIDLVFYLEFNKLSWCHNTSIDEQAKKLYPFISKDWKNFSKFSKLFIIDGLDDYSTGSPFFNELAKTMKSPNSKCIVAGRIRAIKVFKSEIDDFLRKEKELTKLNASFQVTGLNFDEVKRNIENVPINNGREKINGYINESHFVKAMASVPFCFKKVCEVISSSSMDGKYSFNSMTEFYYHIFLYFLKTHININNKPVDAMIRFISEVCELAYHGLNEGLVNFPYSEVQSLKDFQEIEYKKFIAFFGNQLANHSFLNFCASIYAYNHLSPKEIIDNKKLRVCVSMICGIMNFKDNFKDGLGDYFNSRTADSNEERKNQLLIMICGKCSC